MADDAAAASAEEPQVTFSVKSSSDAKYVLTVPAAITVADIKTKLSGADYADLPVERQRLIYSGRVLKDHDTLASVKIKDGHTVHLVKGAASNARQNPASHGSSTTNNTPAAPQVPTNLATGTGHDPLAGLTGARYAGFHGLPGADTFGPDGGMGPPDPSQMLRMMDDPNFLQQINEAMENPAIQNMLTNHPMLRDNPAIQQALRNPEMRRMMFSPEMMRMQLQMQQQQMNRGGGDFPAPGVTDTTPQAGGTGANTTNPTQPALNPLAMFGGGAGGQTNPFASLFAPGAANPFAPNPNSNTTPATSPPATASAGQGTPANPTPSTQPPSPFANLFGNAAQPGEQNPLAQMTQQMMQNPDMMRAAMQMFGGMGGGAGAAPPATGDAAANPFANLFGPGGSFPAGFPAFGGAASPPPPADTRPPEEVYEAQLRQLNDMGFYEFERNVQALRRSGGSVQGAIEHLLGGS
ncbi:uncharacterized protein BDZ99DRAFT_54514 [Mytilinidion resinicola]|uniref:Ubiquitin-domain-containing protein n=1 Tax=Mytilinidion resinicola TaxID=574789 RepID=A0A6A6YHV9_9PEZI|nr:uncharacterized protein BDZ99DRAFT_54514 [Mytilinidion resinicola]KAF2808381.1 hypothetical protein BDZ99DRAFT_54514 [Mytilinidion resinicola]